MRQELYPGAPGITFTKCPVPGTVLSKLSRSMEKETPPPAGVNLNKSPDTEEKILAPVENSDDFAPSSVIAFVTDKVSDVL